MPGTHLKPFITRNRAACYAEGTLATLAYLETWGSVNDESALCSHATRSMCKCSCSNVSMCRLLLFIAFLKLYPWVAGRGVLCHYMGSQEGAGLRDAHRRSSHHEERSQPAEAGKEGAVLGSPFPAAHKVQDRRPVLQGVPDGEVQYLHPKDGVYPEKVNQGRQAVGANDRSIGKNPNPVSVSARPCMVSDPVTPSKKENAALLAFCCESQCNFGPACVSHGAARSQLPLYAQRRPFGAQNRRAQLP